MRRGNNTLMVAGLFGMIILIILFIFGGMFLTSIVSTVDEAAVNGTELQDVSAAVQPLGAGLSALIPVFIAVCVVGLLAIAFMMLIQSRARKR